MRSMVVEVLNLLMTLENFSSSYLIDLRDFRTYLGNLIRSVLPTSYLALA